MADTKLQYVVANRQAIGFILGAGPKGWRAYDQDGGRIGLFESESTAAEAVCQHAEAAPVADEGG